MSISPWIAWRYFFSRRMGYYGPMLTMVAIASIAIGMFSLIVVMSVMRGFKAELNDRLIGFNAHITLSKMSDDAKGLSPSEVEGLLGTGDVRDISPYVQGEVIAQSNTMGDLLAQGARVRGIDRTKLGALEELDIFIDENSDGLAGRAGLPGAIVGYDILSQLAVHPLFGDKIELIAPLAYLAPTGELSPNKKTFAVTGVFKAGLYDYDTKYILTDMEEAKKLLGEQALEGWHIRLADPSDVPAVLSRMRSNLPGGWRAEGWHEQNRKLFAALKLERIAMGAILSMALLIASFSIAGVMLLVTSAKRKDIAILQSVGMKYSHVMKIFLYNALYIGSIGSAIGLASAFTVCVAMGRWPPRLPDSYYLDYLPVELNPAAAIILSLLGVLVALIAAGYPVRQAMRMSVTDVLRYE